MADPKVTKSPKTPSSEAKLQSTPKSKSKKSSGKRVVVDQFLVVPRDQSLLESNHNLSNDNQQLSKPESRKQSKVARQLEMIEPSPPQSTTVSPPRMPTANDRRLFCDTCKIYCTSLISMQQHNAGRRHRIFSLHKEWSVFDRDISAIHEL